MLHAPVTQADHIRGDRNAPITLVEYGDYQCPHCAAAQPNVIMLLRQYSREVRLVFRHFPLTEIHPQAETAAESAEYAGSHGLFWEMHDGIYANQDRLSLPVLFALASALGLPEAGLRRSLATREYAAKVRADFLGGVRSGVNGTPTFFINGRRHDGTYMLDDLAQAVEQQLAVGAEP
ncbi:MAG: oxidoreductase [Rhodospirillales bacterium]|nr:oxidoreductase [Rhodospirillales bacterium]